ncbi:LpxL/LpxP family Kdo(2)-lipid IV(A) lauroyl/palmitoleoyl acyltransferase [Lysobacter soyae]|uniref:Lipid A biosynthesis acyltransferase n=1 Tax=Lysobacter soyae TaxID=2764185 RepID=A0ABX8WQH5_9GAMM|nr:LpxL/LpxP family Kdo(2)-lipid IV(A) lauroyl/palmitoleoyl acyltransferase [Lysobacter sp. CJ11]QYR52807.1 LpxL/LpxP family Kdo(2)-lipid IV(A) lauroyl/palmitoleoyl acyltransferase [Lysobacter sp. CJ11]
MTDLPDTQLPLHLLPAWFGLAMLRGCGRMSWPLQKALGALVGTLAFHLMPARRRAAEINIALCFPNLAASERDALVRESFRDLGIGLFEFARAWWGDAERFKRTVTIEGLEHLKALQAQGKGVLLISGHFMTLEMCGRLLCDHVALAGMYRPYRNPLMERAVMEGRLRYASHMFGNHETRAALRHLKKGGFLWYAPDQDMRGKETVFVPFFGVPAATITATHQFAKISGCAVVPFFHRREGDRYVLRIAPPLANFPSEDVVEDTARVNAAIEAMVREAPTQYLWIHRRFKRQPDGVSRYSA